jgi:hypothetical protein
MAVNFQDVSYSRRFRALVCFGPMTEFTGFRAGEYFQVIVDPKMQSPGGAYIRFDGMAHGNEIHGWQRVAALTVCEVLEELEETPDEAPIVMRTVEA